MKTKLTLLSIIAATFLSCSSDSATDSVNCNCETVTEVTYQAIDPPLETSNGQITWVRHYKGTNDCTGELKTWSSSYEIMAVGEKKCD